MKNLILTASWGLIVGFAGGGMSVLEPAPELWVLYTLGSVISGAGLGLIVGGDRI